MANHRWQIHGNLATLTSELGVARFDLDSPSSGLSIRGDRFHTEPLFAFLIADEPEEMFARGQDLVLRIPPRSSDLVSYEVRYHISADARSLDLILSAQTQLLDSKPETKVVSTCHDAEFIEPQGDDSQTGTGDLPYCIVRPPGGEVSLLLMVHPTDFHRSLLDADSGKITFWVFPDSLEKGVIRRARFRLQVLDRSGDEAEASRIYSQSWHEAPPLAV